MNRVEVNLGSIAKPLTGEATFRVYRSASMIEVGKNSIEFLVVLIGACWGNSQRLDSGVACAIELDAPRETGKELCIIRPLKKFGFRKGEGNGVLSGLNKA